MTERRRPRFRIEIPRDVADAAAVPDDLDSEVYGPYAIPDTVRRRRAGVIYFIAAGLGALGVVAGLPSWIWLTTVVPLLLVGGYHLVAGWRLRVREREALEIANRDAGFAVGHASAQLGFVGWRARPVWNVLIFSADEPPSRRALGRVDAVDGRLRGSHTEDVPEAG